MTNKPLSMPEAKAIGDGYKTFLELSEKKIRTANDDSEQAGLQQFLNTQLLAHASELLGCWIAVRTEYEPLIAGVTGLLRRAQPVPTKE